MKIILALFALCGTLCAQAVRIDPLPVLSVSSASGAGFPVVIAVPGAAVTLCNYPANGTACTNYATTYLDASGGVTCPASSQIVLAGTAACTNTTSTQGAFGFWVLPGNYAYTETLPNGQHFGPYPVSAGGGGGSGSVSNVSFGTVPAWLVGATANATSTPVLSISAATGQTSHQVVGTCGSATVFGPCSLVASDLPSSLTQNTSGTSSGFTGNLTGDVTSTGMATTVVKVNGLAVPTSTSCLGSNSLGQLIIGTCSGGGSETISIAGGTPISPSAGNVDLPLPALASAGFGTRTVITGTGDTAVNTVNAEQTAIDVQTASSGAVPNSDQGGSIWWSGTSAGTRTLPQAGLGTNWTTGRRVTVWMLPGSAALTIQATGTPTPSTINGVAGGTGVTFAANGSGTTSIMHVIETDGTNYVAN